MTASDEDQRLRSVALQNAREILAARQSAENELVRAKESLETQALELAHSLGVMRATLEATSDGIVVTDDEGRIVACNERYRGMWGLSDTQVEGSSHKAILERVSEQVEDPAEFLARIEAIRTSHAESLNVVVLRSGHILERYSTVQSLRGEAVGRVWSYRDVTLRVRAEEALKDETRRLELLVETAQALAATQDIHELLQRVTDAATRLSRAQFGAFFFNTVDARGESFTLYTLSGAPQEAFAKFPLPRATALFGPTFRGERTVRYDDVLAQPEYGESPPYHGMPPGHLPVRSYLAVPVVSPSGTVHGGLFFGHKETRVFTARDEVAVQSLAAQAAISLDNALLLERNARSQEQLRQLNEDLEQRVAQRSAELVKSEQQFQQLVAGVTDYAIYMLDPTGRVVSWNPGVGRIKGYTADEIVGKEFTLFYTDEDRASGLPQRALQTAEKTGKFEGEGWRVRKDGTRFWASVLIDSGSRQRRQAHRICQGHARPDRASGHPGAAPSVAEDGSHRAAHRRRRP